MNTEDNYLKSKKYQLAGFMRASEKMQGIFQPLIEELEKEIASLEKEAEPKALSFLQLLEKYEHPFAKVLLDGSLEGFAKTQFVFTEKEALKFAAEIYLTLLAKELNGEIGEKCEQGYPMWDSRNNQVVTIRQGSLKIGSFTFSAESAIKAFAYSPEAKTMFNLYFGREEAK